MGDDLQSLSVSGVLTLLKIEPMIDDFLFL